MYIHAFSTITELAKLFLKMPRYGDVDHAAELERLTQERATWEREVQRLKENNAELEKSLSKALEDADSSVARTALMKTKIAQMEQCLSALGKVAESRRDQMALAQEALAAKQALMNAVKGDLAAREAELDARPTS
jgi:chromosome segregation ATPase